MRTTLVSTAVVLLSCHDPAATTAPLAPPPPPPLPAAASGALAVPSGSSQVSLSWTDNSSNEDGFRILIDDGFNWVLNTTVVAGTTSVSLTAVAERDVCYLVVAFNATGEAPPEVPPSNFACTAAPAAPTDLIVTRVDAETVVLTWSDNSVVEDGYQVRLLQSDCSDEVCTCDSDWGCPGPQTIHLADLAANTAAYTGRNIVPAGYKYNQLYVVARRDGGSSDPSDRVPWP